MSTAPSQNDYRTVTPYLIAPDVPRLIRFLADAFGAVERCRLARPDGSVMHAEVTIGDSIVMLGEPDPGVPPLPPAPPMPASFFLRVDDADAAYHRALRAGATSLAEPSDKPHARERYGGVTDPAGNRWWPSSPMK